MDQTQPDFKRWACPAVDPERFRPKSLRTADWLFLRRRKDSERMRRLWDRHRQTKSDGAHASTKDIARRQREWAEACRWPESPSRLAKEEPSPLAARSLAVVRSGIVGKNSRHWWRSRSIAADPMPVRRAKPLQSRVCALPNASNRGRPSTNAIDGAIVPAQLP